MTNCLELTEYKLADGADPDAFVQAAAAISDWAAAQPGFQHRSLVNRGADGWIEFVWWAAETDAKAAGARFMEDNGEAPFMAMIDPGSVKIAHYPVAHMSAGG